MINVVFFFNDTATTEIYTLSLHDALPISGDGRQGLDERLLDERVGALAWVADSHVDDLHAARLRPALRLFEADRSEEHTSELQSRQYLVCRLLLEKKTKTNSHTTHSPPSI